MKAPGPFIQNIVEYRGKGGGQEVSIRSSLSDIKTKIVKSQLVKWLV